MIKAFLKRVLNISGFYRKTAWWSLRVAILEQDPDGLIGRLRSIEPDLSKQYSKELGPATDYDFNELKLRGMHVFQCVMMLEALKRLPAGAEKTVVDIGDSAGTHMLYLKELVKGKFSVSTLSVNLDKRAVDKIKAKGLDAKLCRAEDLDLGDRKIDLFVSFEMVEHLHNPAIFFRNIAKKSKCDRFVVTVPYLRKSRVGLYHTRSRSDSKIYAEEEHIFELCPEDWKLLMLHSGWKTVYSRIYYQYPRKIPLLSNILAAFWRKTDFEGFFGCILEKDTEFSDRYLDWESD